MAVTVEQARTILDGEQFSPDQAFDALAAIGRHGTFVDRNEARDLVIRALDRRSQFSGSAHELLQGLVREYGLFPYLRDIVELPFADQIAYEAHRPAAWSFREDLVFHSEQAMVYERLLAGENVVLSAPTSFGKSRSDRRDLGRARLRQCRDRCSDARAHGRDETPTRPSQ